MRVIKITIYAFMLIFLVLFSGCTTTQNKVTEVKPPILVRTTPVLVVSTPVATNTTIIPTPFVGLTSVDVNLHFIDLAFGGGNMYLARLEPENNLIIISISGKNSEDVETIEEFADQFNDLSESAKLSKNLKEGTTGQIQIKFVTPDGLKAIDLRASQSPGGLNKEFKNGNVSNVKIKDNVIYINSNLEGADRRHYLLLSILYELGFEGTTMKYPDSIFYDQGNSVSSLSKIDEKAIQIMYSPALWNGMTIDDVKKVILLPSS